MKKSASQPKYRQPQLDDNRTLAEQAAAAPTKPERSKPAVNPAKNKVVPLYKPGQKAPLGFWARVPGRNLETAVVVFGVTGLGVAIGVPLGAWLYLSGLLPG